MIRRLSRTTVVLALVVAFPGLACAQITITLKNSFIEQYKDKVTISASFTVDKAHKKPNAPSKDGDMHVAGRADEIGLPTVAEIMNAASETAAVNAIHAVEGTGKPVALTGIWRIWCEHGGNSDQIQGNPLDVIDTTNPPHVFEIHPLLTVGDRSVISGLKPIVGFTTKDAQTAFTNYENLHAEISQNAAAGTTTIVTGMGGYNYVEFIMEINEAATHDVEDGRMVMASVYSLDGDLLVSNRRMVFAKDTGPEQKVKGLKKGDRLHVLGIPRVDLSLVSWRTSHTADRPDVLRWNLPYEMIVVATYPARRLPTK